MLKITGKQKRFLRSKANTLTPIFSVQTHSDITVVQTIGRTLVLFLPAQEDKYKRISVELAKI